MYAVLEVLQLVSFFIVDVFTQLEVTIIVVKVDWEVHLDCLFGLLLVL